MSQSIRTRAANGILLALGRVAEEGGMLEDDLIQVIREELHIRPRLIQGRLDSLTRCGLIARTEQRGRIASGIAYHITPRGVAVLAGEPHDLADCEVIHG